jgi:hypothetical protein
MVVVCDTFDYEDYPVYVMPGENARERAAECDAQSMQRVMEVYRLADSIEEQLAEDRVFRYD